MKGQNFDYGDGFYEEDLPQEEPVTDEEYAGSDKERPVKRKKFKKKRSFGVRVLRGIAALLGVWLIAIGVLLIVILCRVTYTGESPDSSAIAANGTELRHESGIDNILLFGEDNHAQGEHGRSDSMILLTIDHKHSKLKMTSLMRDLYLEIPGFGTDKLNAAYAYGGAKLATETIEYNFGIQIDDYIIVDFNSFTAMIDSLGGIDMELTYDEVAYIDWQSYRNHQTESEAELDADSYDYHENDEGDQVTNIHLNGRQSLWYARDRDSAGSDFDRTWRQRRVMDTLLSKLKSSDPLSASCAAVSLSGYLTTNMNPFDLTGKGFGVLTALSWERKESRIPSTDNYYNDWTDSGQVLVISDTELQKERLYDFVFGDEE